MRIVVFGSMGQVAWELRRSLQPLGEVISLGQAQCDQRVPGAARDCIETLRPAVVVIASAYTAVDSAEDDGETARRLNAEAVGEIGAASRQVGAAVVHYSTDYVFDGRSMQAYAEHDATNPQSVYGQTKLAGEELLRDVNPAHLIFRTSWVYGARGKNFVLTILRAALQRPVLRVVDDQCGSPTWSRTIAEVTSQVLARALASGSLTEVLAAHGGVYHLASAGDTTWYEFARRLGDWLKHRNPGTTVAEVLPTTTAAFGAKAPRPSNSRLDCRRLEKEWQIRLPRWDADLSLVLEELGERAYFDAR